MSVSAAPLLSLSPYADLPATLPPGARVLALDTSTDRLSVALGCPDQPEGWLLHEGVGGAQASATLIPLIRSLLAQAGWQLAELDAIAFGCGPGSFTGLRTACAVVQGLAFAARPDGIPVLPVNTLLAVAEQARWQREQRGEACPERLVAALDARMDELYVAELALAGSPAQLRLVSGPWLSAPEALQLADGWPEAGALAVEAGKRRHEGAGADRQQRTGSGGGRIGDMGRRAAPEPARDAGLRDQRRHRTGNEEGRQQAQQHM
ncbi:tRNA (adenosine(37)-N6)-threonylcarbamoyltransferase complex dimerization subunit type 1 TsaB, partial [Malikia spinosa]|nr:tRNA (adenosine(37)-N6)-threonylcarbamoyltransferase complex dimerization subunit type 1 TsaB [Malikia spinosa]